MVKVIIQGCGEFEIANERVSELLNWLAANRVVQTQQQSVTGVYEQQNVRYPGQQLING